MFTKRSSLVLVSLLCIGLLAYFLAQQIHRYSATKAEWLLVRVVKPPFFVDYYAVDINTGKVIENIPPILTRQPQWSADENWILFYSEGFEGFQEGLLQGFLYVKEEISLFNPSSGNEVSLLVEDGDYPQWSPDGKKIAYRVSNIDYSQLDYGEFEKLDRNTITSIYIMNVSCITQERSCQLQPEFLVYGDDPSWSPDNQKVVYANNNAIYVVDLNDTGSPRQIMPERKSISCLEPAWSNNGEQIIMRCNDIRGFTIFDYESGEKKILENPIYGGVRATWNSTDERIVFEHFYLEKDREVPYSSLYIMDADGSNISQLTNRKGEYINWFLWVPKSAEPLLKSCWLFCR